MRERRLLAAAAVFFFLEQIRLAIDIGIRTTSEDQAIFWAAARDYLHFHFTEPFFYGSPYSSHFEAMLAVPLLAFGVGPQIAVPIATIVLTALPWILLALFAAKRGRLRLAAGVLCTRFLFPLDYGAINTQAAHGTGVALVGIVSTFVLEETAGLEAYFVFGFVGLLATLLYPTSIFICAPVGAWLLLERFRKRAMWVGDSCGAMLSGTLYLAGRGFYASHPNFVLHPQWSLQFSWSMYFEAVSKIHDHLLSVTPMFMSSGVFLALAAVLVVGASIRTKKWAVGAAGLVALLGVVASFGFNKMRDGDESFEFALSRVYLALPFLGAWLVVLFSPGLKISRRVGEACLGFLFIFALARQVAFAKEIARLLAVPSPIVPISKTQEVLDRCHRLQELTTANGAEIVIESENKVDTYACGALGHPALKTLLPSYDRRTARLLEEDATTRHVFLVVDGGTSVCEKAQAQGLSCKSASENPQVAVIRSTGISAVALARELGMKVRSF